MKKVSLIIATAASLMLTPAYAEEPWTELGVYIFATEISGEVKLRSITADVDASFSDILDNLDIGFMGYIEHRRDQWSFIGDIAYLRVGDDKAATAGRALEIDVEAEMSQLTLEGFATYRFFDEANEGSDLGIDFLFGARHTTLEIDLDLDLSAPGIGPIPGFSASGSRDREEDWIDAVIGARFEGDYHNGWGSTVWFDLGEGSDSSSYQIMALASYRGDNSNWKLFGGYRVLHLEYDTGSGDSKFAVDLDYTGPMFGVNYRL